jgi:hypothetical protein
VNLSREEALRGVQEFLARTGQTTSKIREVMDVEELQRRNLREPSIYGIDVHGCWLVYLEQPGWAIRSSQIVAVSKDTGQVVYLGSACDEG